MRLFTAFMLFLFSAVFTSGLFAEENPTAPSNLRIDGIAYDSKRPEESIAMINSLALHKGDEYRGFKIAEIAADHVMIVSAESGTPYELTPGDGQTNVQKREGWNPLKDLKLPDMPDMSNKKKPAGARPAAKTQKTDKETADALKKLNPFNTLYESKARVEKQIDEIKAEQNKRIDLLNNIMDDMEQKPQSQDQK